MNEEAAKKLREPFPPSAVGKLPRGGVQLDYVGHAAVTDRLLEVDPEWSWEPVAFADDGGPLVRISNKDAVLWIRLTVAGTTRLGVGIVGADAFERDKQLISDAIRNAAMRFGVALDLWTKEDLHAEPPPEPVKLMEGWDDLDEQRQAHDAYRALGEGLTALEREQAKAWNSRQGYGWPMSKRQLGLATEELQRLAAHELVRDQTGEQAILVEELDDE